MTDDVHILLIDDTAYETTYTTKYKQRKQWTTPDLGTLTAFIPGTIEHVFVREGQHVKPGDEVLILEAMKMKNVVTAPLDAIVKRIHVQAGDRVQNKQILVEFE